MNMTPEPSRSPFGNAVNPSLEAAGATSCRARSRKALPTSPAPIFALALLWCAAAAAGEGTAEVEQAERARFAAMIARDVEALDRMVANDLYYCHSNAEVENKARFLETIRTQRLRYDAIDIREISVHLLAADIAMVSGLVRFKGNIAGQDLELDLRYLDSYALRDGRWQLLAWQSTRVPPAASPASRSPPKDTGVTR